MHNGETSPAHRTSPARHHNAPHVSCVHACDCVRSGQGVPFVAASVMERVRVCAPAPQAPAQDPQSLQNETMQFWHANVLHVSSSRSAGQSLPWLFPIVVMSRVRNLGPCHADNHSVRPTQTLRATQHQTHLVPPPHTAVQPDQEPHSPTTQPLAHACWKHSSDSTSSGQLPMGPSVWLRDRVRVP